MTDQQDPFSTNRALWNERTKHHVGSAFYDVEGFVAGGSSLSKIELDLLGNVQGKRILHLQCHFGQGTLELARMGAQVTGLDISDNAIAEARKLALRCSLCADWVMGNVIDHMPELDGQFDAVFTSFGAIGWFPDLEPWAANIRRYLKPNGRLVFAEFHPVIWMFDNGINEIIYSYFNREMIVENEPGTYADKDAPLALTSCTWNHDLGEVLTALLDQGMHIERFTELDGSPHDCFANTVRGEDGLYRIKGKVGKLPLVYGLSALNTGR